MAKAQPQSEPSPEPAPARPDHHGPQVAHPDERKRPRWGRRLFRVVFILLLLLAVLVAAGPMLLSTGPGTRLLLAQVNSRVDGHLKIDDLSLAWFSGIGARGVKYSSGDGVHEVSAGRIDLADTSLWALMTGDRKLGRIVVKDLHGVTIEPQHDAAPAPPVENDTSDEGDGDGDATPDGDGAPSPPPAKESPGLLNGLAFDLEVDGMSWRYHAPDIKPVDVVSSQLTLSLADGGDAHLQVRGAMTQGEESGKFAVDTQLASLLDADGRVQLSQAEYAVDVSMQQVPVDALARLLAGRTYNNKAVAHVFGSPQRVAALLGGRWAAGELRAIGSLDDLEGTLRLHAQQFDADLPLQSDGQRVSFGDATTLRLELTPEAFALLFPERGLVLDGPVLLTCERPRFEMPFESVAAAKDGLVLRAVVNSGDWSLTDAEGQRVSLASPKLGLAGDPMGTELVAALDALVTLVEPGEAQQAADDARPTSGRLKIAGLSTGQPVYTWKLIDAPTAVVEWAYGGAGGLAAAMGPVLQSVDGRLAWVDGRPGRGEVAMNWDAQTKAPLAGALAVVPPVRFELDEAGILTTQDGDDIELRIQVTEAMGDFWLGQVHPILFDAKSADRPVRIVVDGSTFASPLGSGALNRAQIDASLDLGTVRFGEGSLLGRIVEWTGHAGEQAKFDPAQVTLRDGELRYDQLALEVGNVRLRFQGAVDLVEQALTEMSVRVPSESLVKVFQDLEGVVEPGDELVIPMRGALRDPEVDLEAFRSEVVRLVSAAPRRELEREIGGLLGRAREAVEDEAGEEGGEVVEGLLRRFFGGGDREGE